MEKSPFQDFKAYGLTTIGERGQIVIPKEIRKMMRVKPGDKFFVCTRAGKVIAMVKPDHFDEMIMEMTNFLKKIKKTRENKIK